MAEAISAYRQIAATDEFKEMERQRSRARHNEAAALRHAAEIAAKNATEVERERWQIVIAKKESEKDMAYKELAEREAAHAVEVADKNTALANQEALIKELMAKLAEGK